jgi:hypothetical protein
MYIDIVAALSGALLSAQSAEPGWQLARVSFSHEGLGGNWQSDAIPAVYTLDPDMHGVTLVCDASSYQVRFGTSPGSMENSIDGRQTRSIRRTTIELFVDDERVWRGDGQHWTQFQIVIPLGREPAAAVFNAIVRGNGVTYYWRGRGPFELATPAPDDHFKTFARQCRELQDGSGG